ncbi:AaceriAFR058Cp [[Ashbya] aceris (nom. inval.)]|nr:AaceriAFR058Cp [[Ashbya] aceris (nom. inval.)]
MLAVDELNALAREHVPYAREVFTDEFLKDWATNADRLIAEYRSLSKASEQEDFVYKVFAEGLLFTHGALRGLVADYGPLASLLSALCENSSTNARILANLINCFPRHGEDEANMVDLLQKLTGMDFEFSASLVEKLLLHRWTKEQTSLYKRSLISEKYHLKKYNLLFESPLGYSQICMLLHVAYADKDRFQSAEYYWRQIQFVAGKYTLDPIRVLDVILRVSSVYVHHHHEFLVLLLQHSDYWPLQKSDPFVWETLNVGGSSVASQLIAYKLTNEKFDHRYMDMVCVLIREGFVSYLSIFDSLGPDDETLGRYVEEYYADLSKQSQEGSLNPLAMAAALPDEDDCSPAVNDNKAEDKAAQAALSDQKEKDDQKQERERKNRQYKVKRTGKWRLVTSCLNHGLLVPALYSIRTNEKTALSIDNLIESVLRLFEHMIRPLHENAINAPSYQPTPKVKMKKAHSGLPSKHGRLIYECLSPNTKEKYLLNTRYVFYYKNWADRLPVIGDVDSLFYHSHEILGLLGSKLSASPALISMLSSIGVHDISTSENSEQAIENWINYFRKFIFPALGGLEEDFIANINAYNLLKLFPFEKRYFLYHEMYSKISDADIFVRLSFNKVQRKVRGLLKSLSIDHIDDKVNEVSRLVSSNPLAALDPIVNQIENYDKVSELVVISAKGFPDFAYDVLQYVLLLKLTSGRDILQTDGINQHTWIQRLSVFIAGLANSCPKMDLTNILIFTVKNLHKDYNASLPVLKELVSKVGGIQSLNHISWKQLQMLNSGPSLQKAARSLILDTRQDSFEAARSITQTFMKVGAISELLVMLCNLNVLTQSPDIHYKILSTKCDDSNSLLWTLIEMFKYTLTREEFVAHVLPFDELVNDYNVPTEWSFCIWRDYIDEMRHEGDTSISQIDAVIDKTEFRHVSFQHLDKPLFTSFWKLTLYDVNFNKELYDETRKALNAKLDRIKLQREKNTLLNEVQEVMSNCLAHQKAFKIVQEMLQVNRATWFPELSQERVQAYLQFCILPRTLFSSSDATYSALFTIALLGVHDSITVFEHMIESHILGGLLFSCTVSEATNVGFFYGIIIKTFEQARSEESFDNNKLARLYHLYSVLLYDLRLLLSETNYMSIRNTIQFLNQISPMFPVVDEQIRDVCRSLESKLSDETREDIKLPCNALIGHLKSRLKTACRKQDFYELPEEEQTEIDNFEKEKAKINEYEAAVAKETERKKLEQGKLQKEGAKAAVATGEKKGKAYAGTSESKEYEKGQVSEDLHPISYQGSQILENIDSICKLLNSEGVDELPQYIRVLYFKDEMKKELSNYKGNLDAFRQKLAAILTDYFYSMVKWPNSNPLFAQKASELEAACMQCGPPTPKATKMKVMADDLYGDDIPFNASNAKSAKPQRESRFSDTKTPAAPASEAKSADGKLQPDRFNKNSVKDIPRPQPRFKESTPKQVSPVTKKDEKPTVSRFHNSKPSAPKVPPAKPEPKPVNLRDRVGSRFEGRQDPATSRFSGARSESTRYPQPSARQLDSNPESRFRNVPKDPPRKRPTTDYRYNVDTKRPRKEDDHRRKPNSDRRPDAQPVPPTGPKGSGTFSRFR